MFKNFVGYSNLSVGLIFLILICFMLIIKMSYANETVNNNCVVLYTTIQMSFFLCIKYLVEPTGMIGKYLEEAFCGCCQQLFQRAEKFHSCIQFVSVYLPFHLLLNVEALQTCLGPPLSTSVMELLDPVFLSVSLFLTHTWWDIMHPRSDDFVSGRKKRCRDQDYLFKVFFELFTS